MHFSNSPRARPDPSYSFESPTRPEARFSVSKKARPDPSPFTKVEARPKPEKVKPDLPLLMTHVCSYASLVSKRFVPDLDTGSLLVCTIGSCMYFTVGRPNRSTASPRFVLLLIVLSASFIYLNVVLPPFILSTEDIYVTRFLRNCIPIFFAYTIL